MRLLTCALAALVIVSGCSAPPAGETDVAPPVSAPAPAQPSQTTGPHVAPHEFVEVAGQADVIIVDVRTPAEVAEGHLPGAVFSDLSQPGFRDEIAAWDRDATYAVYCRSGNRSRDALAIMADLGFADVVGLEGGILDWVAAGGSIVVP